MAHSRCAALAVLVLLASSSAKAAPPPPPEFKELVDTGHVRFEFYDPQVKRYERPGVTRFLARYTWDFRFDVRKRNHQGQQRITVLPQIVRIEMELDHVIHLPASYDNAALFDRSLVIHEFDHVAISTDPRPRRLVEHLARRLKVIERNVPLEEVVNEQLVSKIVNEELERRQAAVRDVIEFNNRQLDQLSAFGNQSLENREQFFATRFTRENLVEAGFPYLNDVADLVRRPDYLQPALARKKALRPKAGQVPQGALDP